MEGLKCYRCNQKLEQNYEGYAVDHACNGDLTNTDSKKDSKQQAEIFKGLKRLRRGWSLVFGVVLGVGQYAKFGLLFNDRCVLASDDLYELFARFNCTYEVENGGLEYLERNR